MQLLPAALGSAHQSITPHRRCSGTRTSMDPSQHHLPLLPTCSQGKWSSGGSAVQVIEVCVASARDEQAREEVPAEVKLALNVDHPNIVRLLQHACRLSRDDCSDGAQVLSHSQSTAVLSGCRAMPIVLCMSQQMLTQPASTVRAPAARLAGAVQTGRSRTQQLVHAQHWPGQPQMRMLPLARPSAGGRLC